MPAKKEKRVLILGGGFGGVVAAKELLKRKPANLSVALIDKNAYHSFPSDYYEAATVALPEKSYQGLARQAFRNVRGSIAIPFSDIFSGDTITLMRGEVAGVDFEDAAVALADGSVEPYDYLIVALGSETNFFGIPHLENRALTLKSVADTLNVRNAIDELFTRVPKDDVMRIVIGGGGFTGCELAGELIGYVSRLSAIHGRPKGNVECLIVEAGQSILGSTALWVQRTAAARLKKLGVQVRTNARITDVEEESLLLETGDPIPFHLLIWTAGVTANRLAETLDGVAREKHSCLVIDIWLRLKDHQNVYAVGDIAFCTDAKTKKPLPQTAQIAIDQGVYAARHIVATERKQKRITPYRPVPVRYIIPLGGKYAIAELGWMRFAGFAGWVLKRLIALRYFLKLVSLPKAFRLWRESTQLFLGNDVRR